MRMFYALGILFLAVPSPKANDGSAAAAVGDWFRSAYTEWAADASRCLGQPRAASATLYGLQRSDPHLSASDRQRVNALLARGLEAANVTRGVTAAEHTGLIAPTVSQSQTDVAALSAALGRIASADLVVLSTVLRPRPDEIHLQLVAFARDAEGVYRCNASEMFGLDLRTLALVEPSASENDHLTLDGAHRTLIGDVAAHLTTVPALGFQRAGADCGLSRRAADRFKDLWFASDVSGTRLAPAEPGALGNRISLRYQNGDAPGVLQVSLALMEGEAIVFERMRFAVVSEDALADCADGVHSASVAAAQSEPTPAVCPQTGTIEAFRLSPSRGTVGTRLSVSVEVSGCTPHFFALSGQSVTPLPTALFDQSFPRANVRRFEISTETRKGLVLQEADPDGPHQIGLFCACEEETEPEALAQWLRGLAETALAAGVREDRSRLSDGTAYAFGTIVKTSP